VVNNIGEGVKDFTGKDEYQFGDITKTLWSKISPKKPNDKKRYEVEDDSRQIDEL